MMEASAVGTVSPQPARSPNLVDVSYVLVRQQLEWHLRPVDPAAFEKGSRGVLKLARNMIYIYVYVCM